MSARVSRGKSRRSKPWAASRRFASEISLRGEISTDVRDVARAYTAIIEHGEPGRAYNVCRGDAVAIQEILDVLVSLSTVPVEVKVDPERYHALDAALIVGDATRLRDELGFSPTYSLRETLEDLLNDWRQRLAVQTKGMGEPKETP